MCTVTRWFALAVVCNLCATAPMAAHSGDRVYPFFEVADDVLSEIDLHDGLIDEWAELLGPPSLTAQDFLIFNSDEAPRVSDPSDLDFQIWLGWNGTSKRIYVAAIFVDNVHVGAGDPGAGFFMEDAVWFAIDGDHDGSTRFDRFGPVSEQGSQFYYAVPESTEGPTIVRFFFNHAESGWPNQPPYGDGGGSVAGEGPSFWTMEFYVTPFDLLMLEQPDESVISDLSVDRILGFWFVVQDFDEATLGSYDNYLLGPLVPRSRADTDAWFDGVLVPAISDVSAVAADSWGRIKASFAE